jgi:sugar phosphate permease
MLVTVCFSYLDRMNISYALPKIALDYGWTVKETGAYGGLLMSMFYVGYGLSNIFLSPIAERFGPRKSIIVVILLFSFFTMLGAPFGMMFTAFIAIRILLGLGEGTHFPMINVLTKRWFPTNERSRANGIWVLGIFGSMIIAPFLVVPVIEAWGWRAMFIVVGCMGIFISIPLVYFFVHDTPRDDPRISEAELSYIEDGLEKDELIGEESFWDGIKHFLKQKTYWLALGGGIINNMVAHGLINWLPTYFTSARKLPFADLTYATSLPYVFSFFGVALWSYLGDKTNKRAMISAIGFLGGGIVVFFAATAASMAMVVALFALTIFINVAYAANEFAIVQHIVPKNRVATGVGLYNGLAMMIGGGLGPVVVGSVVSATGDYTMGILSLSVLSIIGAIIMLILGRLLKY